MTAEVRTEPIVHERQIDARPETVFAFFTDPEKLTRWLASEATLDPRPGGVCLQTHIGRDGERHALRQVARRAVERVQDGGARRAR